jgi:hypothetical protein
MYKIYSICKTFLAKKGITSYFAKIINIDDINGWIKMRCYYNEQILDRLFQLAPIAAALGSNLTVGKIVQINIYQNGPTIEITFEKTEKTTIDYTDEEEIYSRNPNNNFLDTNIFGTIK